MKSKDNVKIKLGEARSTAISTVGRAEILQMLRDRHNVIHTMDTGSESLLIFTEECFRELLQQFYWGRLHPLNVDEMQLSLVGHLFTHDGVGSPCLTALCQYIIPCTPIKCSPVSAQLSPEEEAKKDQRLWSLNRNVKRCKPEPFYQLYGEYRHLGYAHTHPGNLGVFFSSVDREDFKRMFDRPGCPGGVALVANPHRRRLAAFGGKNASPLSVAVAMQLTGIEQEGLPAASLAEPALGSLLTDLYEGKVSLVRKSLPQTASVTALGNSLCSCDIAREEKSAAPTWGGERAMWHCEPRTLLELGLLSNYDHRKRTGLLEVLWIESGSMKPEDIAEGYRYTTRVICLDSYRQPRCLEIVTKGKPPLKVKFSSEGQRPFKAPMRLNKRCKMKLDLPC